MTYPLRRKLPERSLQETFLLLAQMTTPHGFESYCWPFLPLTQGNTAHHIDAKNNVHIWVPTKNGNDSRIMWSSHLDTACRDVELVNFRRTKSGKIGTDGRTILGADCKIGAAIMIHMIQAEIPGWYVFHAGEECGLIGANFHAKQKEWACDIDVAIAFDRKDRSSVITHQRGGQRCCSDLFADEFALLLNESDVGDAAGFSYKKDPTGLITDTGAYMERVSECTNISVGYFHQHTHNEVQDMHHAEALLAAIVENKECWEDIGSHRDPSKTEYNWNRSYQGGQSGYHGEGKPHLLPSATGQNGKATTSSSDAGRSTPVEGKGVGGQGRNSNATLPVVLTPSNHSDDLTRSHSFASACCQFAERMVALNRGRNATFADYYSRAEKRLEELLGVGKIRERADEIFAISTQGMAEAERRARNELLNEYEAMHGGMLFPPEGGVTDTKPFPPAPSQRQEEPQPEWPTSPNGGKPPWWNTPFTEEAYKKYLERGGSAELWEAHFASNIDEGGENGATIPIDPASEDDPPLPAVPYYCGNCDRTHIPDTCDRPYLIQFCPNCRCVTERVTPDHPANNKQVADAQLVDSLKRGNVRGVTPRVVVMKTDTGWQGMPLEPARSASTEVVATPAPSGKKKAKKKYWNDRHTRPGVQGL